MSKYFVFIIVTVVLNAASQLLMKSGMSQVGQAEFSASRLVNLLMGAVTNPFIVLGLVTMTISMGTHLMSLSRFDVSFAFPFLSIAYVIVAAWGHFVMGETVNLTRMIGIGTIILGTVILARS
ncbi:MAG: transporter [Confluentimicrobium sp.]|jgi:multidrug transporter EmrE-like cation transporter|uniref:Multidrug transporter EmrE-like cation transporter n=1 Tax=Actibacterium naphthalenivorans TaxID=1614693 RepID=A0A840C5C3_9RHOB|tara:strand:+ start:1697 stop:2065 length:369 start_codon:yes stop_codon:yes gene_type:complete